MIRSGRIPSADRLLLVFSDIEIGAGGVTDDHPNSGPLAELIRSYNDPAFNGLDIDLVLGGDTFDFLKVPVDGEYHRHVSAGVALAKLALVEAAHGDFFDALRAFLAHAGGGRRQVYFIVGNHDAELLFPEVEETLRTRLHGGKRVRFPGFSLVAGDVLIEHGGQADPLFHMDPERPFVTWRGRRLLRLPWGTVALIDVVLPYHAEFCHLDRVRPRDRLMALMPEFKEFVVGSYWRYWTRDYWRTFAGDPVRGVNWTMLKEIAHRFAFNNPDVAISEHYRKLVVEDPRFRVRVVGHEHNPGWWSYGNRKLLRTGTFRAEFMMRDGDDRLDPIPPVYAEIFMRDGHAVLSQLVEVEPAPLPDGYVPESLQSLLPGIRHHLERLEGRTAIEKEAAAQSAREEGPGD